MSEFETKEKADALARARDYPYRVPAHSYVYRDSGIEAFDADATRGRTPVLAIGSNQSPERLAQKFGHDASHVIPVQRAHLRDFDVVYSAHIASYGAVPAMLQTSEGSLVTLAVTWLTDMQLEIMNDSEIAAANYDFAELEGVALTFDDGRTSGRAFAYVSTRGHLRHDAGSAIALKAMNCERRRYPALTTPEVLEIVRERLARDLAADEFVLRLTSDADYRRGIIDALAAHAEAFGHPVRRVKGRGQRGTSGRGSSGR